MTITIVLSLLVCLVGLLLYLLVDAAKFPKLIEVGRLMFFMGGLAFLLLFHQGGLVVH